MVGHKRLALSVFLCAVIAAVSLAADVPKDSKTVTYLSANPKWTKLSFYPLEDGGVYMKFCARVAIESGGFAQPSCVEREIEGSERNEALDFVDFRAVPMWQKSEGF